MTLAWWDLTTNRKPVSFRKPSVTSGPNLRKKNGTPKFQVSSTNTRNVWYGYIYLNFNKLVTPRPNPRLFKKKRLMTTPRLWGAPASVFCFVLVVVVSGWWKKNLMLKCKGSRERFSHLLTDRQDKWGKKILQKIPSIFLRRTTLIQYLLLYKVIYSLLCCFVGCCWEGVACMFCVFCFCFDLYVCLCMLVCMLVYACMYACVYWVCVGAGSLLGRDLL